MRSSKTMLVNRIRPVGALSLVSCLALMGGCSSSKNKDAQDANNVVIDNEDEFKEDGVEAMQEFGGMHEEKVTRTFKRLKDDLAKCLTDASAKHDYMIGNVEFLVTVGRDGQVLHSQMERSDLGNYEAERCLLAILATSRWPKPVGGHKGLARSGMGFDPGSVRPPVQWEASDIESTLSAAGNAERLNQCREGGPFKITAYVGTNGKVLSAGVAHTDDTGEESAECLVHAVEEIKFPSPGSWPAKVSFQR